MRAFNIERARDCAPASRCARAGHAKPLRVTVNLPAPTTFSMRSRQSQSELSSTSATKRWRARSSISRASIGACSCVGDVDTAHGRISIVDDYGHHPTEIAATVEAIRQGWPGRRVVLAFQPHRYSRTRDLLDDFARVLSGMDVLLVTEVYAAGEAPIAERQRPRDLQAVRSRGQVEPVFVERVEDLATALADVLRDGDVIVTMGAGNIGAVAHELPAQLRALPGARGKRK